jgi:hypothetical protein
MFTKEEIGLLGSKDGHAWWWLYLIFKKRICYFSGVLVY